MKLTDELSFQIGETNKVLVKVLRIRRILQGIWDKEKG